MIGEIERKLYSKAKESTKRSYSPYSHFRVGAAVRTKSGKIFFGANVENVSYGLTICAERVAICNALMAGDKEIEYIAIYAAKSDASPCGACRQFIIEFGSSIRVIYRKNKKVISVPISELIPDSFFLD